MHMQGIMRSAFFLFAVFAGVGSAVAEEVSPLIPAPADQPAGAQPATAPVPATTAGAPAATSSPPAAGTAQPLPSPQPAASIRHDGFGWTGRLGYETGGDEVVTVLFTDGSTESLTAGEGLSIGVGGHYRVPQTRFDFSALVGYKLGQVAARNASIELSRTTFELRADAYLTDDIWVSAGPVFHRNIKADMAGFAPNFTLNDANGFAFRIGWKVIAITHTQMTYRDSFGDTYDAGSTGIEVIGKF